MHTYTYIRNNSSVSQNFILRFKTNTGEQKKNCFRFTLIVNSFL